MFFQKYDESVQPATTKNSLFKIEGEIQRKTMTTDRVIKFSFNKHLELYRRRKKNLVY